MKKNIFVSFVSVLILGFLVGACQPKEDDQPEQATLTLSAQTLILDNQVQNPTSPQVTFNTNQSKVVVTAQADWLDAEVQGNGIIIKAKANDKGTDRKADVLVFAGSLMDKIMVTQSAADIVLEVSPDHKTIANVGEELYISVKSNSSSWEVEPSTFDWIHVEKFTSELLKVSVLPNKTPDVREGQLFAKLGSITKQIAITQVGVGKSKFVLPLMERRPSRIEILEYEKSVGNYYLDLLYAVPRWGQNEESLIFACSSTVFHTVTYKTNVVKGAISVIELESDDSEALKSVEFKNYLKDNGFVIGQVNADGFQATNNKTNYAISVEFSNSKTTSSMVKFTPIVKQDKAYPTFKKFPWSKSDILRKPEWTSGKIIEMEKQAGSIIRTVNSEKYPSLLELIYATVKESEEREVPHTRVYFIDVDDEGVTNDLAGEILTIWEDLSLGAWQDGKTFLLTNEFKELMANEGFEFLKEASNMLFFYNKDKKRMIVPRGAKFKDILDGAPVFSINCFPYDAEDASAKDPVLQNMFFDKLSARLKAMELQ